MSKQPLFFKAAYYLPSPRLSTSPFTSLNRLMNGFLCRDRFNILNKHSEFRMDTEADPVPTPFTEPVSISDLIDARAVELLSRNQQIVVQYSGGVDSTVALIALMKHLPENEWDRITLFYDEGGIEENPEFWSMLNLTKIRKTLLLPSEFVEAMREDDYDLIVSGRCADALFGPNIHVMVPNAYHLPWLDGIREAFKVIPRTKISDTSLEVIEAVYSDYAKAFGLTLDQFCEFAWLFNWGVKWGHVANFTNLQLAGSKNTNKGVAFFDTLDFQRWSLSRFDTLHEANIYKDARLYKKPLKQYIYEYNHIDSYYTHKGKQDSLSRLHTVNNSITVLTNQGYQIYSFKDCGHCKLKLISRVLDVFRKNPQNL